MERVATRTSTRPPPCPTAAPCPYRTPFGRQHSSLLHAVLMERVATRTSTRPPPCPTSAPCPYRTPFGRQHSSLLHAVLMEPPGHAPGPHPAPHPPLVPTGRGHAHSRFDCQPSSGRVTHMTPFGCQHSSG